MNKNTINKFSKLDAETQLKVIGDCREINVAPHSSFNDFLAYKCDRLKICVNSDFINPNLISVFCADQIADDAMRCCSSKGGAREVAKQFLLHRDSFNKLVKESLDDQKRTLNIHRTGADKIFKFLNDFSKAYTKELRQEYNDLRSDEWVRATLEKLDLHYDSEGMPV